MLRRRCPFHDWLCVLLVCADREELRFQQSFPLNLAVELFVMVNLPLCQCYSIAKFFRLIVYFDATLESLVNLDAPERYCFSFSNQAAGWEADQKSYELARSRPE